MYTKYKHISIFGTLNINISHNPKYFFCQPPLILLLHPRFLASHNPKHLMILIIKFALISFSSSSFSSLFLSPPHLALTHSIAEIFEATFIASCRLLPSSDSSRRLFPSSDNNRRLLFGSSPPSIDCSAHFTFSLVLVLLGGFEMCS